MTVKPMPPYFLLKLSKKEQKEKKEKQGDILIVRTDDDMSRNLERGEVVAIGSLAGKYFPEVNVGDTLLIHHSVEGDAKSYNERLIHSDDTHNYYVAAPFAYRGERNAIYGVIKGDSVIPNKEYIFLHPNPDKDPIPLQDLVDGVGYETSQQMAVTQSGLFVFESWEESRDQKQERAQALQSEVKQLSKSIGGDERRQNRDEEIAAAIQQKEAEAAKITKSISAQKFQWLNVAFYNPEFLEHYGNIECIEDTDNVVILSDAADVTIEVFGKTYIVAQHKYIVLLDRRDSLVGQLGVTIRKEDL